MMPAFGISCVLLQDICIYNSMHVHVTAAHLHVMALVELPVAVPYAAYLTLHLQTHTALHLLTPAGSQLGSHPKAGPALFQKCNQARVPDQQAPRKHCGQPWCKRTSHT